MEAQAVSLCGAVNERTCRGSASACASFVTATAKSASRVNASDALRATLDLFETGLGSMRQSLRRDHSEATGFVDGYT
jgi:hypothetical protein